MKLRLFGPVNISVAGPDCEIEIEDVHNLTIEGCVAVQGCSKNSRHIKEKFDVDGYVFVFNNEIKKESMIDVVFNKFSVLLIGLFLVLLGLKLTICPTLYWTVVGFPMYGPTLISGAVALCFWYKYKRRGAYKRYACPKDLFKDLDI